MKYATTCKFCKKPISIETNDSYDGISDPLKLRPLAACNSCADLRVERRELSSKLANLCFVIQSATDKERANKTDRWRQMLTTLSRQYAEMVRKWQKAPYLSWDEECVSLILENPEQWPDIIARLWNLYEPELITEP